MPGYLVMPGTGITGACCMNLNTLGLGAVMVHTVDSARLDMPVPLQRLQAHIHCVETTKG
jgi:hypothetical protein